jgi:hypothetical protein
MATLQGVIEFELSYTEIIRVKLICAIKTFDASDWQIAVQQASKSLPSSPVF